MMSKKYIPPLGYHWLTPFYDRLCDWFGFGQQLKRQIVTRLDLEPGQRLLDVGAGTGTFLVELITAQPDVDATGIDPDPRALTIAQAKLTGINRPPKLIQGSADHLPFTDQSFERVVSTLVFHHLPTATKTQAIAEIYRVLKNNGRFYLIDFGQPQNVFQAGLLWLGSWFDGRENLQANLQGILPDMLRATGFTVAEIAKPYRALRFIQATK